MRFITATISALYILASPSLSTAQSPSSSLQWSSTISTDLSAKISEGKYQTVTSVMIRQKGDIIYEAYFNGATAQTQHNTRSVTKTINSMLVGAAISDGDIESTNTKIHSFFDDKKPFAHDDKRKHDITVEDILTMSSPLECNDWNNFSRGNEERMYLIEDMAQFYFDLPIRGFPVWENSPQKSPYGRAFSYCTAGAQIAGYLAARAAHQDLERYAQQRLFTPLGIFEVKWPRTGNNTIMASGGLPLRTEALSRLAELYLNKGVWNGKRILPRSWVEQSLSPKATVNETTEYGYLWWLGTYDIKGQKHSAAFMNGNGGNRVIIMPDHDISVVITKTDYNSRGMHEAAKALFDDFVVNNIR